MTSSFTDKKLEDLSRDGHMGRYRLVGLLATGGMAQVYLALSGQLPGFRTLVVVKRILPHLASNTQFVHMFLDEARIAARIDHPNIARILEVGHQEDEYFLAMEVVQGRPLSALLRKARKQPQNPLSHAQTAYIIAQAANGLGYAHALTDADGQPMNVVHRDVSPQNILVSFGGAVKVIDFGVARALGRVTETVPGGLKGKIQYMSPEQVRGRTVDQRSDVYALGIVLWEALCGRRLYHRESEMETLTAIVDEPVAPPSKFVPTSARLERIVMQALEKDPAKRFQNAAEMALALERHAFASDNFNPLQVSTTMKKLFAADYTRWNRTVAAAMDLEGPPETWTNTNGTFLNPGAIDLRAHGPRLVPHPGLTPVTASDEPRGDSRSVTTAVTATDESKSSTRSATSVAVISAPSIPTPPSHRRLGAGIAIVGATVALILSVFTLLRPARTVTVIGDVPAPVARHVAPGEMGTIPGGSKPPHPGPKAGAPVATAEPSERTAAPVRRDVPEVQDVQEAQNVWKEGPASQPIAPVALIPPPAQKQSLTKTRPAARKRGSRRPSHERVAHNEGAAAPAPGEAGEKAGRAAAPAAITQPPAGTGCSILLGTVPWTEVWIDGRNTNAHTPYHSGEIACGKHEVTFKRDDLGITKSATITLRDGETVKRSFQLGTPAK